MLNVALPKELNPLFSEFRSSDWEHSYRQDYLNSDRLQTIITIAFATLAIIIFTYSDYHHFNISWKFYGLLTVRGILIFVSVVCLMKLWRVTEWNVLDKINLFWAMFFLTVALCISITRPPEFAFNFPIEIVLIFSIYILLPNRLILQIIPAIYMSLGLLVILLKIKNLSSMAELSVGAAILFANIFGIWLSWRYHTDRRIQFYLLRKEKELGEELGKAIETKKTLEGLLPICASCKKIRDDKGYWNQIEEYIRDHSEVEFSHGICHECAKKLYPDLEIHEDK
ncbi:MAG: hypothetical protein JRG81_15220 [Deltaproteobacteria bacterium]|nr:hypothetical protein [Deltaproteobacteria bacterium]